MIWAAVTELVFEILMIRAAVAELIFKVLMIRAAVAELIFKIDICWKYLKHKNEAWVFTPAHIL